MNRQILKLAIPNVLSNLVVPLLSAVDIAMIGRVPGLSHLGAIAVGGMVFNVVYWGLAFLRMGTTGLTAQAFGRDDPAESRNILWRGLSIAVLLGIGLIFLRHPIIHLSMRLVGSSAHIEDLAAVYIDLRMLAAPAVLAAYVFHGWFLGMQNAVVPFAIMVVVNFLNIGLNVFFLQVCGMKSEGVALGTVIAQYAGLALTILLYRRMRPRLPKPPDWRQVLHWDGLQNFLKINRDIFLRTMALIVAFTLFTARSAEMGDDILAVNTILLQLWIFLAYAIDGIAFAAESLIGLYHQSGDMAHLKRIVRRIFAWGFGTCGAFMLAFLLGGRPLLSLFTDKQPIIDLGMRYLFWTVAIPPVNTLAFIWDGVYLGATVTRPLRNFMFIGTFGLFIPLLYGLEPLLGNHGLWAALFAFMLFRGVTLQIVSGKYIFTKPLPSG